MSDPQPEPSPDLQHDLNTIAIVRCALLDVCGLDDVDSLPPTSKFIDDLGCDSLDLVELAIALEEAFGINVPNEDLDQLPTIGDAVEYINAKLWKKSASGELKKF